MTVPSQYLQSLEVSAVVDLYELDARNVSEAFGQAYFYPGRNELGAEIVWQGTTYAAAPIQVEGFEMSGKGSLPRPTLRVANLGGAVGQYLGVTDDFLGSKLIRRRTLKRYLDAANFDGGNAEADPTKYWPDETYYIEQKLSESSDVIEFQLVSALDLQGLKLPKRVIQATVCPWVYEGAECGYSGELPTCAHTLTDCIAHFGSFNDLPFGGFPSCARIR